MPSSDQLEQYFNILLKHEKQVDSDHPYADDKKRFLLFDQMRGEMQKVGSHMHVLSRDLKHSYPSYVGLAEDLGQGFERLAQVSNEEMDHYLRHIVVERLIYSLAQVEGEATRGMLNYLIEALMSLFYEDGEEMVVVIKETLKNLKNPDKKWQLFKKSNDKAIRQRVGEVLTLFEEIEEDLKVAKQGILARDKKMLEVLRQLRGKLGECIVSAAVEHTLSSGTHAEIAGKNKPLIIEEMLAKKQKKLEEELRRSHEEQVQRRNPMHTPLGGIIPPSNKGR